jgi:hypothetical protein
MQGLGNLLSEEQRHHERLERPRVRRIEVYRPARRLKRFVQWRLTRLGIEAEPVLVEVEKRQHRPGRGIAGELGGRSPEAVPNHGVLLHAECGMVAVEPECAGVSLQIVRRLPHRPLRVRPEDDAIGLRHRGSDLARDIFLNGEQALGAKVGVVRLRPQHRGGASVKQAGRDANPVRREPQATLEHVSGAKFAAHAHHIRMRRDTHGRFTAEYGQFLETRELGQHLLGESGGIQFRLRPFPKTRERRNGQRRLVGPRGRRRDGRRGVGAAARGCWNRRRRTPVRESEDQGCNAQGRRDNNDCPWPPLTMR